MISNFIYELHTLIYDFDYDVISSLVLLRFKDN